MLLRTLATFKRTPNRSSAHYNLKDAIPAPFKSSHKNGANKISGVADIACNERRTLNPVDTTHATKVIGKDKKEPIS